VTSGLEVIEPFILQDASALDDGNAVGDTLHFVQQVRGKQNRAAVLHDRLDDRQQNVAPHQRIEAGVGLIEDQ